MLKFVMGMTALAGTVSVAVFHEPGVTEAPFPNHPPPLSATLVWTAWSGKPTGTQKWEVMTVPVVMPGPGLAMLTSPHPDAPFMVTASECDPRYTCVEDIRWPSP